MLSKNTGFTLIELLITLVIMGIMASMAVPAMNGFFSSNKVYGLAERIQTDMEWGRTQAILSSRDIIMTINTATWCYGFDDNADNNPATVCNCTTAANCTVGNIQKTNSIDNFSSTTIATTLPATGITFTNRGFSNLSNRTITVSDGVASAATINITPLGKGSACSNSLSQYVACN